MALTSRISLGLNTNACFDIREHNRTRKNTWFQFSHSKALGTKFDLFRKIDQGQFRVTIYINFVELAPPLPPPSPNMLHTKFQGNRSNGSGKKVFTIYGHAGQFGPVTWNKYKTFISPLPVGCI